MIARASQPSRFRRHGGRSWSQEIETTVAALCTRADLIESRPPPPGVTDAERAAVLNGVRGLLDGALNAARGEEPEYRTLRSWWRGTSIEAAFRKSHQAEAELARLYDPHEVAAEEWPALARVDQALNRDDPVRAEARVLLDLVPGPHKRALLSKLIEVGHEAVDGSHARLRNFRNILLTAAWCIAVLVLAFSVVVLFEPAAVPFCFRPGSANGAGGNLVACPSGGAAPGPMDVVVVALLGLLGGALSAAVSIRNLKGTATPYDVPIALALLKVPAGALTALGALIAIRGEFVPGLSALDSQEQILAYALVFGYAQQLLTGLIDRQAQDLLNSVPSKDAAQNRPQLSVTARREAVV